MESPPPVISSTSPASTASWTVSHVSASSMDASSARDRLPRHLIS